MLEWSEQYNFVFVHTMRTGGTSIKKAFKDSGVLPKRSEGKLTEEEQKEYGIDPQFIGEWRHHLPLREVVKVLRHDGHDYRKITFIRNPWMRVESAYYFMTTYPSFVESNPQVRENLLSYPSFSAAVLDGQALWGIQGEWLSIDNRRVDVDFVGRYETLEADYDRLCRFLKCPCIPLPRRGASSHGTPEWTQEAIDYIAEKERFVTEHFYYDFEGKQS